MDLSDLWPGLICDLENNCGLSYLNAQYMYIYIEFSVNAFECDDEK